MPVQVTYPGVYIEEIPSGVRTITGVATSVAAFIDYFKRGPTDKAVQIFNFGDFEREFGGLDARSEASYAIQQFFLNGGTEAWVVRVAASDAALADAQIDNTIPASAAALTIAAISKGAWGNSLRARVDYGDKDHPVLAGEFNLLLTEYATLGGRTSIVRQELFRNLSMNSAKTNFVGKVVNDKFAGSKMVFVTAAGTDAPLANGSLSGAHNADPVIPASPAVTVTITDGTTTYPATPAAVALGIAPGAQPLTAVAPALERAVRASDPANPAFSGATVSIVGNSLLVLAGAGYPKFRVVFSASATADILKFTNDSTATANAQEYLLGGGALASTAQLGGASGVDGSLPSSTNLIGDLSSKTGIYALEDVDLFNILCLPRTGFVKSSPTAGELTPSQAQAVISVAEAYCEKRRAFFIMETPLDVNEVQEIKDWLSANSTQRHRNAALYYPRILSPDPLNEYRLRSFGASGTIAGLFARTDSSRGVWKAPAGTEAALRNVAALEDALTDQENGALNPLAVNCLRTFPVYGNVCWGARTLDGSDQSASEWKYISVRRTALYIEESLFRGTQWVVFEPNDEPLWAQIRLNLGAFMHGLFRQGAFQGTTPREAYFVKCDKETTTQDDINKGIVNIVVGFAPLKPAEFVIIKLQQIAGQIQA
jgi:phage tail sheath protein FI